MKSVIRWFLVILGVFILVVIPHGSGPTDGYVVVTEPIVLFTWHSFLATIYYTLHHLVMGTTIDGHPIVRVVLSHVHESIGVLFVAFVIVLSVGITKGVYDGIRAYRPTRMSLISEFAQAIIESLPDFFLICTLEFISIMVWIHTKVNIPLVASTTFGAGILLPACIVAMLPSMYLSRMVRMSVENQMGQHYLVTAESKGLRPRYILRRHLIPNTYPAILSAFVPILGMMFSSLVIVEYLLAKEGIVNGIYQALGEFGDDLVYKPVDGNPHLINFTMNDPALTAGYLVSGAVLMLFGWGMVRGLVAIAGYRGVVNPYSTAFRPSGWTGKWALWVGSIMMILLVFLAGIRRMLPLPDPSATDIMEHLPGDNFRMPAYPPLTGPHILGSDYLGHDLLSQAIAGTYPTLLHLGLITAVIVVISISLSFLSSIWRIPGVRSAIEVWNRLFTVVPGVLACLFILDMPNVFWFGAHTTQDQVIWGIRHVVIFVLVVSITEIGRVTAALQFVLDDLNQKTYMEAAEINGNSSWGKFYRHALRPYAQSVVEQVVITASRVLLLVATLGFFSHSMDTQWNQNDTLSEVVNTHVVQTTDWASLIAQNAHDWFHYPWVSFAPVLFITYTVLALNFVRIGILHKMENKVKAEPRRKVSNRTVEGTGNDRHISHQHNSPAI